MFDLANLRTLTLDQLHAWGIYTLAEDREDASGTLHAAGSEFRFDHAVVNTITGDAEVHGGMGGSAPGAIVFRCRAWEHRRVFAPTGLEFRPSGNSRPAEAPPPPPEVANPEDWIPWLAAQPDWADAAAVLDGSRRAPPGWDSARADADVLRRAALHFAARARQPAVARWLADRSLTLYHTWMSQATSGGEGTAMEHQVRSELAELRAILAA